MAIVPSNMAKTKAGFLIGSCCSGVISLALIITSYATTNWVTATLPQEGGDASSVNHGLFTGSHDRNVIGAVSNFNLYATCSFGNNVCYWSCLSTQGERDDELLKIYATGSAVFSCKPSVRAFSDPLKAPRGSSTIDPDEFMPAGLWLSTVFFLSCSLVFNVAALCSNIYNIFGNPIEIYATTEALPVYYIASGITTLLTLILWGCQYSMYTSNNIAVYDTLVGTQETEAELGWSYYLLIPAELELIVAFSLLYLRKYLINKKESETIIKGDDVNHDANNILY